MEEISMRVDNWHSKLLAYIDRQERKPFAYGSNDCLLMISGAVEAVTGIDHAAPFRGRYKSMQEGRALIGKPVLAFIRAVFAEVHVSLAVDGDIAARKEMGQWSFGVLIGAHFYVQTETGLGILPRAAAEKAFKVD
jgi:hypothetical protein